MKNNTPTKHPKRRVKNRREDNEAHDLLSECARVFLFSLASSRGDDHAYEGALRCSGEEAVHANEK